MKTWLSKRPIVSICLAAAIVILGSISGWLPVDRAARWVISPVGHLLTSTGRSVGNWFEEIGDVGSLKKANESLSEQNRQLSEQLNQLVTAEQENRQLREQLHFQQKSAIASIGADIVNYQPDKVRSFIRINRGHGDGIKPGQPVVAGGSLVGTVTQVDGRTSEVMLVTDGEFRVLVKSLQHEAAGVVKGRPPDGLTMERISRDHPVARDELVITSGLDGQFPPGLIVGTISDVQFSQEAIFQTASIKPLVEAINLRTVLVLRY